MNGKRFIMMSIKILSCLLFLAFCVVGCGSAEAIRGYRYKTTNYTLEKAVQKVINSNPNIFVDTTEDKVKYRRYPEKINDTTTILIPVSKLRGKDRVYFESYFKAYLKITIKKGPIENYYIFRYYGDDQYRNTSSSSAIFISLARDQQGNSLHQGHNEKGQFRSKLARDFTDLFETEVVHKIDRELNLQHKVE